MAPWKESSGIDSSKRLVQWLQGYSGCWCCCIEVWLTRIGKVFLWAKIPLGFLSRFDHFHKFRVGFLRVQFFPPLLTSPELQLHCHWGYICVTTWCDFYLLPGLCWLLWTGNVLDYGKIWPNFAKCKCGSSTKRHFFLWKDSFFGWTMWGCTTLSTQIAGFFAAPPVLINSPFQIVDCFRFVLS